MNITQAASELSARGFVILALVVFGILFVVSLADLWLIRPRPKALDKTRADTSVGPIAPPALGEYLNAFVKTRPWVAVAIAIVFGAMITHFFWYIDHG